MLSPPPETASAASPGLHALLTSAAFAPLPNLGWIRVTGSDRVRWLNGMVTNNIAALKSGEGCYNFFLNAQGRIQADCTAFLLEDCILLETAADRIPALIEMLDRFIIMDDVELSPVDDYDGVLIAGPQALSLLEHMGVVAPPMEPLLRKQFQHRGSTVDVSLRDGLFTPCFELWTDPTTSSLLCGDLLLEGVSPATSENLERLRILSGTPLYGVDIRNSETAKDLPQETNQTRALHFSKGCYLGQEIVERIHSRGAVHRTFHGFTLAGDLPAPGTQLFEPSTSERAVGELTSVARIQLPSGTTQIFALGYIRREALGKHLPITYPGGVATPASLPFQL